MGRLSGRGWAGISTRAPSFIVLLVRGLVPSLWRFGHLGLCCRNGLGGGRLEERRRLGMGWEMGGGWGRGIRSVKGAGSKMGYCV
jgi:hypothetical protein